MTYQHLFNFHSYRDYLKERLEEKGPRSGLKRRAAEALAVHTTFISQVVLGKADLSLDQAENMNLFLRHNEEEGEYFIDLVILERASEEKLRARYQKKIQRKKIEKGQIKNNLKSSQELEIEVQEKFYSSSLYGLLHVLASIPKYQTRKTLIAATGHSPKVAEEAVDFLLRIGVLKSQKDKIVPGPVSIHLSRESRFIRHHHTNWRLLTMEQMGRAEPSDLHYSLAFSCSEKDAAKIRKAVLNTLNEMSHLIQASPSEEVFVYCFDLFQWR